MNIAYFLQSALHCWIFIVLMIFVIINTVVIKVFVHEVLYMIVSLKETDYVFNTEDLSFEMEEALGERGRDSTGIVSEGAHGRTEKPEFKRRKMDQTLQACCVPSWM